jgi:hypothetical protein
MLDKFKPVWSCVLMLLLVSSIWVVVALPSLSFTVHAQQASPVMPQPSGLPSYAGLVAKGNSFVTSVEQTAQYQSLAHGVSFYVDPYSSYGFYSGPVAQGDYVIITLFSSNREAYIRADVNNATGAILDMSLTNLTSTKPEFGSNSHWSGYAAPDCESTLLGYCTQYWPVSEAYGNI